MSFGSILAHARFAALPGSQKRRWSTDGARTRWHGSNLRSHLIPTSSALWLSRSFAEYASLAALGSRLNLQHKSKCCVEGLDLTPAVDYVDDPCAQAILDLQIQRIGAVYDLSTVRHLARFTI